MIRSKRSSAGGLLLATVAGIGVLTVTLVVATPAPAAACSCDVNPPAEEAREQHGAVFTATVVSTRTIGHELRGEHVARMAVEEVYSGEIAATVDVSTQVDGAMCGIGFAAGDRWLVYGGKHADGGVGTYACSRTAALEYADAELQPSDQAREDLATFGPGDAPLDGEQPRSDPWPWGWITVGFLLLSVGLIAAAVRYARRVGGTEAPPEW